MDTLLVRRERGVWHVTLNRPESRNAMSMRMVEELHAVLAEAEGDEASRVIVLRGTGGHFCSGGDIRDMAQARQGGSDSLCETSRAFGELGAAFAATGLALVAVVEGTVMGGGFGLACAADVTLAGTSARFRLPETSLGIVPAQIAALIVERLGYAEAKRLTVTGATLDAAQALALRLVHEVHAAERLDAALDTLLTQILHNAPKAVAASKRLVAKARWQSAVSLVEEAADVFSAAVTGPEGSEGTLAFVQKRKPAWAPPHV